MSTPTKYYTEPEIKKIISDGNPRYVCLENSFGGRIIPFNTVKEKHSKEHTERILKYLANDNLCSEGIYFVVTTNVLHESSHIKYPVKKGNPDLTAIKPAPKMEEKPNQKEIYSFEKLLTIHQELAEYKTKCLMYEMENKNLLATIEDLENEISEHESREAAPSGLGDSGSLLAAKALSMLEGFLQPQPAPVSEPSPAPAPVSEPSPAPIRMTYEDILNLLASNPDLVDRLGNDLNKKSNSENEIHDTERAEN